MGFFSRVFGGSSSEAPQKAGRPAAGSLVGKEAAQLARLLISELVLYNKETLEVARQRGDIYSVLKEEIDRSRKMYNERVDLQRVDRDCFYFEMVARLARGRPEILGVPPPPLLLRFDRTPNARGQSER